MNRQVRATWSLILSATILATGCQPTQPFYFKDDGDLSHYLDVATEIEYPDVEEPSLDEVNGALPPLTLENADDYVMWDLTLEEATRITLCNSQVMRQLGGVVASTAPESITRTIISPVAVTTTYDPALVESATGTALGSPFSGTGVEAALSEFDARLDASVFWQKNDRPVNSTFGNLLSPVLLQDRGTFTAGITKTTAYGTEFSFRNNTNYDSNNNLVSRLTPSDWTTNFEAGFVHPLLQGGGTQYNRIAGPLSFDQYAAGVANANDGVVIARIRTDQSLADFEGGVRNLMRDVEQTYWELYFAYRDLAAQKMGRDSALETWRRVHALYVTGSRGGSADREAQSRSQYYLFRSQVERALNNIFQLENRLRFLMGLSMSDGRLIRPADEPTTARATFPWSDIHCEALARRVELRKQKWEIKRRELELIAARNHLLPRLDAVGTYRWLGAGDDLIDTERSGQPPFAPGSTAFESLTGGNFQEWQLGLRLDIPIGFRNQLSGVRHHELLLARERAVLEDLELEVSHQLGDAIRAADLSYQLTQTDLNRRVAAETEVRAVRAAYEADRVTLDLLLDAQRRRAEAESAYYRSLVDYNMAIMNVHYRKGSLLDYNAVYLAEGPWPGKAYFDALRQARKRDASTYLDYGFTRPSVFSRGPYDQGCTSCQTIEAEPDLIYEGEVLPEGVEELPQPMPEQSSQLSPNSHDSRDLGPALESAGAISASYETSGGEAQGDANQSRPAKPPAPFAEPEEIGGALVPQGPQQGTPETNAGASQPKEQGQHRAENPWRSQIQPAAGFPQLVGAAGPWQNTDERQENHTATQIAANLAVGYGLER